MAKHTDANNNIWYDGCTLTNCTYVHCGENTTGTVTNVNYAEIGENNSVTISDGSYISIGDNNTNVTVSNSDYIIVGSDNLNVTVGSHNNSRFTGRTGGNSIVIGHRVIATEITGEIAEVFKTTNGAIDGTFNDVKQSGMVVLDNSNGNRLDNSKRVDLTDTNNNVISTTNLTLEKRDAFLDYALIDKVTRVKINKPVFEKQSDASGVILDTQADELINIAKDAAPKGGEPAPKDTYSLVNGLWSLNEKRINTI